MFKKIIYNETKFENDEIYIIKLLKMIKIKDVKEIKCILKLKSSLLMISFDNNSKINCFEIKTKST